MRFLSMIRVDESTAQPPSEKMMADMGRLMDEMTRNGALISTAGLAPTKHGARLRLQGGRLTRTDGPFTESKEVIGGYAIVEAESLDHAIKLTNRFLEIHDTHYNVECELRPLAGPDFGCGLEK
jgi:hypothetical protein